MADTANITYHENWLYMRLSNTDPSYIDGIRQSLLTWKKHKRKNQEVLLRAAPILLAYREAFELFGDNLHQSPSMQLFWHEKDAADTPIGLEIDYLYEVQKIPTAKLVNRDRAILTAAPGLGKTVIACTALGRAWRNVVVIVAPLTLIEGWAEAVEVWWLKDTRDSLRVPTVEIWYGKKDVIPLEEAPDHRVVITTSDVIGAIEEQGTLDMVFGDRSHDGNSVLIIDESYRYKNRKAYRSRAMEQLAYLFDVKWLLSGMPVARFVDDLYMQLHILFPGTFTSYWTFVHRYCIVDETRWGTKIAGDRPGALEMMQADLADILIPCDYPDHIPDWKPVIVECPMGPAQDYIYNTLRTKFTVEAEALGRETKLTLKTIMSLTGRLLQVASNPTLLEGHNVSSKWDKLEELLKDDPLPALVWVQYTETARLLEARLSGKHWLQVGVITGKTKVQERTRLVKAFQDGTINVLILNTAIGKYGLTLTAARTSYYLELNYDAEAFYQTLFRARRIISKESVKLVYLLATRSGATSRTVDHLVHGILLDRSQRAQLLTVGDLIGTL